MLPKQHRFKVPRDWARVRKSLSGREEGAVVRLRFGRNALKRHRYAISIPKGVVPGARRRNRLKRILRETVRAIPREGRTGYDILLQLKAAGRSAEFEKSLREETLALFGRIT